MKLGPLQTKWLESLKSGKYPKTKKALRNNEGYCCLGVGCEILGIDGLALEGECHFQYENDNDFSTTVMPNGSWESLGLMDEAGSFINENIQGDMCKKLNELNIVIGLKISSLVALNDITEDFSLIIRIIEECPEAVFTEPK